MHILLIALRVSAGVHNNQYIIAQFLNLWSTDLLGVREVCDGIATFAGWSSDKFIIMSDKFELWQL